MGKIFQLSISGAIDNIWRWYLKNQLYTKGLFERMFFLERPVKMSRKRILKQHVVKRISMTSSSLYLRAMRRTAAQREFNYLAVRNSVSLLHGLWFEIQRSCCWMKPLPHWIVRARRWCRRRWIKLPKDGRRSPSRID